VSELPPIPEFDPRRTRLAVARGVLRAAVLTVLLLAAGSVVLQLVSYQWQTRGDRRERLQLVVGVGSQVALPGYRVLPASCCTTHLRSMELWQSAEPRAAARLRPQLELRHSLGLLGGLRRGFWPPLPRTPVDDALGTAVDPAETRRLLARLPEGIVATAVVAFAEPLDQDGLEALLARRKPATTLLEMPPVFLEPPYGARRLGLVAPLAWPEPWAVDREVEWDEIRVEGAVESRTRELTEADDDSLRHFAEWVAQLRDADDANLRAVGLPGVEALRRLAAEPRAFGVILERAGRDELLGWLGDDAVRRVVLADVAFDLGPGLPGEAESRADAGAGGSGHDSNGRPRRRQPSL
jgi:hypothetical protein